LGRPRIHHFTRCASLLHTHSLSPPAAAVSRDALIREALTALAACCEADKELDVANTVLAVVGKGERFHVIEGQALAPLLVGIQQPAAVAAAEAAVAGGEGGAGAAAPEAGAGEMQVE
jgi:hypothetical protein